MRRAIDNYFSSKWGSGISVNRTQYDSNGTETTSSANTTQIVYYVKILKLISG